MNCKRILSVLFLVALAFALPAQPFRTVIETERLMSFGSRPAFRVEFPTTAAKQVETQWRDFVRKTFDVKLKKEKKTGEWVAFDLRSPMLGNETYTLYSTVEPLGDDGGSALNVWFDAGSHFLSRRENATRAEEASGALRQFYYDVRRETIGRNIKDEEDRLKELESKQKRLQRDNDELNRDIRSYQEKIKKAEEAIRQNEKDQETTVVDIEAQRRVVEDAKRRRENVENEGN